MATHRLAVALGLCLLPALANAALVPVGSAFEIVPSLTFPPQVDPSGGAGEVIRSAPVAAAAGGGFAVAWVEESLFSGEVTTSAVRGRLVGNGGALGNQFAAGESTGTQNVPRASCPSIATLGGGRFLLGFATRDDDSHDLWLQTFGAGGIAEPAASEPFAGFSLMLNDLPSVDGNSTGRAAVAWQSAIFSEDGKSVSTDYRVVAFDREGSPASFALALGPSVPSYRPLRPAVAMDRSGRFSAAWLQPTAPDAGTLRVQSFSAHGVQLGPPGVLGGPAVGGVALARSGPSTVVAWARRAGSNTRLRAELVGPDGRRLLPPRILANNLASFDSPTLVAVPGRGYLLAWLEGDLLRALQLGSDLAPQGAPVEVAAARPDLPSVVGHGIGAAVVGSRVLLTWAGALPDGLCPANAIVGQLFDLQ